MRIFRDWRDLPDDARGATIALGNFDGVHLGHAWCCAPPMRRGQMRHWRC